MKNFIKKIFKKFGYKFLIKQEDYKQLLRGYNHWCAIADPDEIYYDISILDDDVDVIAIYKNEKKNYGSIVHIKTFNTGDFDYDMLCAEELLEELRKEN